MPEDVRIMISSVADGSMSKDVDEVTKRKNREKFLKRYDVTLEQSVLVRLEYEGDNYQRYCEVGFEHKGDGMSFDSSIVADALFTRVPGIALFLPVADCVAAVLYDRENRVLGLSHLGRHNLLQQGGTASVKFMQQEFGTRPEALSVWLSPAAGRSNYPLHDFENRSLHEVTLQQLRSAGISMDNITIDSRDTTTDPSLFSHSEFLRGSRKQDGRQAVVAMMTH
jgi:copper oxidase (laccase) domain-containing protein